MRWDKGYTTEYYVTLIDPVSWVDIERIEITGGSIDRSRDGLLESANIKIKRDIGERWVRLWMDAYQSGSAAHEPLFTGLTSVPERELNGLRESYTAECFSVLKPAEDMLLDRGYYAPAGMPIAEIIKKLLDYCPAPFIYNESPPLVYSIVAESGESNLSMIKKMLKAAGQRLRISGSGEISLISEQDKEIAEFDATDFDILEPNIKDKVNRFDCPNVFRAVINDAIAIARDETGSPLSVDSRGREIWREETGCNLKDGELLSEYAKRRLKEEQALSRTLSYTRRYDPRVRPGDTVKIHYPENRIDGFFSVGSQSIEIGRAAKTSETAIGTVAG